MCRRLASVQNPVPRKCATAFQSQETLFTSIFCIRKKRKQKGKIEMEKGEKLKGKANWI